MKLSSVNVFHLLLPFFMLLVPGQSVAYESALVKNNSGQSIFQFNYYTAGEGFRNSDINQCGQGENQPCAPFTRSLNSRERAALERAGAYWAQILSPGKAPAETLLYDIYPVAMHDNASANANFLLVETSERALLYYPVPFFVLEDGITPLKDGSLEHHASVYIGLSPYSLKENSIVTRMPWSMEAVMIHELGHSLGVAAVNGDDDPNAAEFMTPFETYLQYDSEWEKTRDPLEPRWYFHGPLAMKVFGGPVPMEDEGHRQEKSHFGLRNTLMTHRAFRNYTAFVEVEMAALADSGYGIDLRNYFGRSVYTDNTVIINARGFFARNSDGTAYLPGLPNKSPFGMGLHIYGDNNTVYQAADLLADGQGAAGIRVDGVATNLFINPGVRITANGPRGTGLLVSYGSGSAVVHRGGIEATGPEGDAVRFDIGANILDRNFVRNPDGYGDKAQYSYLDTGNLSPDAVNDAALDEYRKAELLLNGPLVKRFDVTGSITGKRNSIIIAGNSHVGEINIMRGGAVRGRMVNDYYFHSDGRATDVTFGRAVAADGQVIPGRVDPGFRYTIGHDIIGWGAPVNDGPGSGRGLFNLHFQAGQSTVMPWAVIKVNQFTLDRGASLLTTADFKNPSRVWSRDFKLAAGSMLGLSKSMQFGPKLKTGASYPVLSFNLLDGSTGALVKQNGFSDQGKLEVGIYDYASYDLLWSDASSTSMTMALTPATPGRRNRMRAGDQATAAPLQMLLSDHGWRKVVNRSAQAWNQCRDKDTDEAWAGRVWGGPYYSYSDYSGSNGLDDVSVNTPGVVVGYEGCRQSLMAGLALNVAWPQADSDGYKNRGESFSLATYFGLKLPLEIELGAAVSYGIIRFDQERSSGGATYTSDYDGQFFRTGLSLGRRFSVNEDVSLRPSMIWEYLHLSLDDYSESGWGLQAQTRDSAGKSLWQSDLGVELAWRPLDAMAVSGRLGWAHIYGDRRTDLKAHFSADSQNRFTSFSDPLNRDSMTLDLTASFSVSEALSIKLDYQNVSGPHNSSHAGEVMAVFEF